MNDLFAALDEAYERRSDAPWRRSCFSTECRSAKTKE